MAFDAMQAELDVARKLFWLVRQDQIFFSGYNEDKRDWDDGAYPAINCNDLLVPGADAEPLSVEDLDKYIDVVKRFPRAGPGAWCAWKRSENLWRESGSAEWMAEYDEALAYLRGCLVDGPNRVNKDKHGYLERHGWEQAEDCYWYHPELLDQGAYSLSEALREQARREACPA